MHFKFLWVALSVLLLSACTSKEERIAETIEQEIIKAENRLENLKQRINDKSLGNIRILTLYAKQLKQQRPDYAELIDQVAQDATINGPLYQSLSQRLYDAKYDKNKLFSNWQEKLSEVQMIAEAATPAVYNDAISDSVNVLADMSKGQLARVNADSKQKELRQNSASDFGAGSQYIGNPQYGQWQTGSNGLSFWEWYGMYALFSDLVGGRRTYYNDWSRRRGYSYYHDYGRSRYTSPARYKKQEALQTKTRKSFASQGKRFTSPYAKQKSGSRTLSRVSKTPPASSFSRRSSYSSGNSASRRSTYSGNTRRGSSRTSRGLSRGK